MRVLVGMKFKRNINCSKDKLVKFRRRRIGFRQFHLEIDEKDNNPENPVNPV